MGSKPIGVAKLRKKKKYYFPTSKEIKEREKYTQKVMERLREYNERNFDLFLSWLKDPEE